MAFGDNILDRLRRHVQNQPDQLVYRFLQDDQEDTRTFRQLDQRVRDLAARFQQHAAFGDRALLLYPPGLEFIEAFLGCLFAGIIAVPAYPPRKNRNADRLEAIINDARPRLILTTRHSIPGVEAAGASVIDTLATDDIQTPAGGGCSFPAIDAETIAFLQYTSGSTGTPKGVMVTHANLTTNEKAIASSFRHTRDCMVVGWLPAFHDMGLIGNLLQPLFVGFPAVLFSPVRFLQKPVRWLEAITQYRATTSGAPNFAYDHCVRSITEEQKKGLDLSSWRIAYNGAEPIRKETLDRFVAAFACCGFRIQAFFPCYGLAESTLFVSGGPPERGPSRLSICGPSLEEHRLALVSPESPKARHIISSGTIADEMQVVVVDPKNCSPCLPGKVGEIWLSSASVAHGYWDRPEETRESFRARLADTGAGPYLRTGDMGFVKDGELFITGRLKDLVIIHGRNLYPQDIEEVVQRVVSFVKANTVAAVSMEAESGEQLALVIEADRSLVQMANAANERGAASADKANGNNGTAAELDALIGKIQEAVSAEFEVALHAVAFVRPGRFPRTSSGKVQRQACLLGLLKGSLDFVHSWQANGSSFVPPGGQGHHFHQGRDLYRLIHDRIVHWLRTALKASIDTINYDTSILSLGVGSVGAVSIALDVESVTGVKIEPDLLYEYRTINRLAQYVESRSAQTAGGTRLSNRCAYHRSGKNFPDGSRQTR